MHEAGTLDRYVPIDVTESMVRAQRAASSSRSSTGCASTASSATSSATSARSRAPVDGRPRIVAFLGGTIGNFTPGSRRRFLRTLARLLGPDDFLLLGTDLVKDPAIIEAAYDDAAGVTAAFNRNVLHVVNRELDADFVPDAFDHVAFFDRDREWIEMRLRAQRPQRVHGRQARAAADVRRGRGAAHRDQREVHARAHRGRPRRRRDGAGRQPHRSGWAVRAEPRARPAEPGRWCGKLPFPPRSSTSRLFAPGPAAPRHG